MDTLSPIANLRSPFPVPRPPRSWLLASPLGLAAVQAFAAVALVVVAHGVPDAGDGGFRGTVNDTVSSGSRRRLALLADAFDWVPGLGLVELGPQGFVWGLRGALLGLAAVQVLALVACRRSPDGEATWRWAVGPVATALILLAFPPFSADVFFYALTGDVANMGENPYRVAPRDFPDHPFLPFSDWKSITSPYGPLWTSFSRNVVAATGTDPTVAVFGFKILAAGAALALAALTHEVAKKLTNDPRRALGAFVLVAWSPVLLLESAGTAHNDGIMMLAAICGLLVLALPRRGTTRIGLAILAASAAIKYATLPLLAAAALWRLRRNARRDGLDPTLGRWMLDAAVVIGVLVLAFAPYWIGLRGTVAILRAQERRFFVNPLWLLPRIGIDRWRGEDAAARFAEDARRVAQWGTAGVVVLALIWLAWTTWRAHSSTDADPAVPDRAALRAQVRAWAAITVALGLLPVSNHVWYAVWPVAPVALAWATGGARLVGCLPAKRRPRRRWFSARVRRGPWGLGWAVVGYLTVSAFVVVAYHAHPAW